MTTRIPVVDGSLNSGATSPLFSSTAPAGPPVKSIIIDDDPNDPRLITSLRESDDGNGGVSFLHVVATRLLWRRDDLGLVELQRAAAAVVVVVVIMPDSPYIFFFFV